MGSLIDTVTGLASPWAYVVIAVLVAAVVLAAHWIGHHHDEVQARLRRQLDRPRIAALRARYRSQLAFVGRRLTPGGAHGLALTVQLLVLALGGWLFAGVLQDVIGRDDLARFDLPVTRYVVAHRTTWLTSAIQTLTWLGSSTVLVPILVAAGIAWRIRRHTWSPLVFLGAAQLGAIALYDLVKVLVARPRPEIGDMVASATGYAFPSGHATQSVAVWGALALVLLPQLPRSRQITVGAAAVTVALLVGLSRVYLGVHWTTDVVGGWVLGALWLSALVLARRTFEPTA